MISGAGPSWNLGLSIEQTWERTTRQCYIPNFNNLNQVVLKKKILNIFYVLYGSNVGHLARGHFGSRDLQLNKLGRGPLDHTTYKISNIRAKWF